MRTGRRCCWRMVAAALVLATSLWPAGGAADGQQALAAAQTPREQADEARRAGDALAQQENWRTAVDRYEQALGLYRQVGDRQGELTALIGLGDAHRNLAEYDRASDDYEQAIALARRLGSRGAEGRALAASGTTYYYLGQFERARALHEQALAIARETGDRAGEWSVLNGMGLALTRQGRHAQALDYFEQGLAVARTIGSRRGEVLLLNNRGDAYTNLGQYTQALQTKQQSLTLAREIGYRFGERIALRGIGTAYSGLGQYDRALEAFEAALVLARELGDRWGEGVLLRSMAGAQLNRGQHARARELAEQAAAVARAIDDPQGEANSLNTVGRAYQSLGDYAQELAAHQQALEIARRVGTRPSELGALNGMGAAYLRLGQPARAREVLTEAVALARQTGDRAAEARSLSSMGGARAAQGDLNAALDWYRQAISVREELRGATSLGEFRTSLAGQDTGLYERAATFAYQLDRPREAFELAERARSRAFLDQLGSTRVETGRAGSSGRLLEEQALRAEISALDARVRENRAQQNAELSAQLAARQVAYTNLLTELRVADPESAALVSVAPLTLPEVQRLLDANTSLLAYFVMSSATLAFVVTRDGFETVRLPVREQELSELVQQFRAFANPPDATGLLARLSASILAPVADRISTPVVGIVPHGSLHYLSFAALPDGPALFGETHTLFSLPSASTLPFVQQKRKGSADRVLALSQSQPAGFPALRYADVEAESIARLYDAPALTGSAATETAFKAQAGQAPIVHVAAHAELNEHAPLFSRILLAPDEQNDGSLTVQEVYGLDLARADLVVLSACETQLGAQSRGDDVVGLNRAFIYAGAPTVLASLWSVDDEATAVLMTAFYRHLRQGAGKAGALQAAQAETRARYPHPYYWAAFVLTGDPGARRQP